MQTPLHLKSSHLNFYESILGGLPTDLSVYHANSVHLSL